MENNRNFAIKRKINQELFALINKWITTNYNSSKKA
jgi:hypothetical protein